MRVRSIRLFGQSAPENRNSDGQSFSLGRLRHADEKIPDWLVEILDDRCPGFLEDEQKLTPKAAKHRPLLLRLEDWIDDHIFGFAKQEGWFSAISYYAIREPAIREPRSAGRSA